MASEIRTLVLDEGILDDLASCDYSVPQEAIGQLPRALSRDEVSDVALQVSSVRGTEATIQGQELEKDLLFSLGETALIKTGDLVTAGNVAKELRARFDLIGYFMLTHKLRKTKRQILQDLMSHPEEPL